MGNTTYKVTPSEVHKFVFCPRQYFFELHLPRRRGLREALRLLLGRLFHVAKGLSSRMSGYSVERRVETLIGNVRLVGRADAVKREDGVVEVIERKSGRAPRRGAWASDVLQAAIYALILIREEGASEARIKIEYRDKAHSYVLDEDLAAMASRVLDDLILVKYYGIVPYPRRGPKRCASCPFRDVCEKLDEKLKPPGDIVEPGSWLEGIGLIPPNTAEAWRQDSPRQDSHEGGSHI